MAALLPVVGGALRFQHSCSDDGRLEPCLSRWALGAVVSGIRLIASFDAEALPLSGGRLLLVPS